MAKVQQPGAVAIIGSTTVHQKRTLGKQFPQVGTGQVCSKLEQFLFLNT